MKFTPEVAHQIISALAAKLPGRSMGPCSIYGTTHWQLVSGFVALVLSNEPQQISLAGNILPSAVLYCANCGNTHLLNLQVLGLDHLLTPEAQATFASPLVPQMPPSGITAPPEIGRSGNPLIPPPRRRTDK